MRSHDGNGPGWAHRIGIHHVYPPRGADAGRRLGTLNFCGEEGMYGEREMQIGRVLSGLLVPSLLKAVDG